MKKAIVVLFLAVVVPLTAQAGEVKITETDSAIIVEYTGEPEAKPVDIKPVSAPIVASEAAAKVDSEDGEPISERDKKKQERFEARAKSRELQRVKQAARASQPSE